MTRKNFFKSEKFCKVSSLERNISKKAVGFLLFVSGGHELSHHSRYTVPGVS